MFGKRATTIEVGGMTFTLRPLTIDQFERLGAACVEAKELTDSKRGFEARLRIQAILHDTLHEAARADDLIEDESIFEEWFDHLDVFEAAAIVIPKVMESAAVGDRSHKRRAAGVALKIKHAMGLK